MYTYIHALGLKNMSVRDGETWRASAGTIPRGAGLLSLCSQVISSPFVANQPHLLLSTRVQPTAAAESTEEKTEDKTEEKTEAAAPETTAPTPAAEETAAPTRAADEVSGGTEEPDAKKAKVTD